MWLAIFVKASVDASGHLRPGHCIRGDSLTRWAQLKKLSIDDWGYSFAGTGCSAGPAV